MTSLSGAGLGQAWVDLRWSGDHGIGRFSAEIQRRLQMHPLNIAGAPWAPWDPWVMARAICAQVPRGAVVFTPGYNSPLVFCRPLVLTVHDLNHIDRPENSSAAKRLYYRVILKRSLNRAFRVLTVSEYSRGRIIEWAGLPESRVINVGNGVDAGYHPGANPFAPGYRYILCVGNRKEHKNEARLLEAFASAALDPEIRLVFTGEPSEALLHRARVLGVESRTVFKGRVAEVDFPGLYTGAVALAFPSLYEGFGLPVVEAMACGTPVLTSEGTALREVAGDAALLIDPLSVPAIAAGLQRLCSEAPLRGHLRERGLLRARDFNWNEVATRVAAVLHQAQAESARL